MIYFVPNETKLSKSLSRRAESKGQFFGEGRQDKWATPRGKVFKVLKVLKMFAQKS